MAASTQLLLQERIGDSAAPLVAAVEPVDEEVGLGVALQLFRELRSADVQLRLIKNGGHRLSEPHEIHAILVELHGLVERIA